MKTPRTILIASLCQVMALALLPSCASDAGEAVADDEAALGAVDTGAGAGKALLDDDPCVLPRSYARKHNYNLVEGKPGDRTIEGTNGRDLIIGTPGDDVINAKGGDDIVCAGYGEDHVYGGDGDDYIDGGGDVDHLHGEDGNDVIHGRGGGDYIFGGGGDDLLFGDILDDHLFGDDGNDLLIGGHGTDVLDGGAGNDYLRGDTGNDAFIGRAGTDVASFITAMPPGQPEIVGKKANRATGVKVDMKNECTEAGDVGGKKQHDGCANGDGGNEPLDGIEIVVGSPYDDVFVADAKGGVKFLGGYGNDDCSGTACGQALPAGSANKVFVYVDAKARDMGVVAIGRDTGDNVEMFWQNGSVRVRGKSGTPLFAGPGCHDDGGTVVCNPNHVLRYVAAWMGDGDDVIKVGAAAEPSSKFPVDMTAHVNGGNGDDFLHGGDEEDVFFTGPTGRDHLHGNGGDDALISESRKWPKKACTPAQAKDDPRCDEDKPKAGQYTDGRDSLYGGEGDDQLVTDYPCGNHIYSGGPGKDVAGFARSGRFPLHAQLAGAASKPQEFHGRAFNPALCGKEDGTNFEDDLEILEAADGNDELWGNNEDNIIWGREGDDRIHGLGGDDTLDGLLGNDWLFGGAGNDKLQGAAGNNHLYQDAD
jgi:Ca2+-binding RTX toxin-like protein